jgi:putative ABC transport system permease protein
MAQLLTESTVLAVLGGLAGLALAYAGVSVLRAIGATSIPRVDEVEINGVVLAFTAAVTLASGFLFGLIPAFSASRADVAGVLKLGGRSVGQGAVGHRVRGALVMTQVALSLILLVGAGLLMKSFAVLQRVEIGFDPREVQVARLRLPDAQYQEVDRVEQFYAALLEQTRRTPGVRSAALVNSAPFAGPNSGLPFILPERPPQPGEPLPDADLRVVSDGYFRTLGIDLVRGRDFTTADRRDARPAVIISETMAKSYWPNVDPLGRELQIGSGAAATRLTIVGIVRDVRYFGLETPAVRPMMYFSFPARPSRTMSLVASTSDGSALMARVRGILRVLDPALPLGSVDSLERLVHQALATQRFALALFGIFAGTALALAAIGIYGVLAYLVRQRTHEMGVRVALGASSGAIMRGVLAGALAVTIPGVLLGLAGAWGLTRLIESLLFGVSPTDLFIFAAVASLLTVTAVAASLLPARRATKADPMLALRGD